MQQLRKLCAKPSQHARRQMQGAVLRWVHARGARHRCDGGRCMVAVGIWSSLRGRSHLEGVGRGREGVRKGVEMMWRRCGGGVEEVWRRCGADVEQMWSRCGARPTWRKSGRGNVSCTHLCNNVDVEAYVEQMWSRCGADVEQMWSRCGGGVEEVWRRRRRDVEETSKRRREGRAVVRSACWGCENSCVARCGGPGERRLRGTAVAGDFFRWLREEERAHTFAGAS